MGAPHGKPARINTPLSVHSRAWHSPLTSCRRGILSLLALGSERKLMACWTGSRPGFARPVAATAGRCLTEALPQDKLLGAAQLVFQWPQHGLSSFCSDWGVLSSTGVG